jgi:hypothetical protein
MGRRLRKEYIDPYVLIRHEIRVPFRNQFLTRALDFALCLVTGAHRRPVC